jgi:flagellar biosynthesis protein FliQ
MPNMESIVLDENEEALAPAVVIATVALLAVFVVGVLVSLVGLVA